MRKDETDSLKGGLVQTVKKFSPRKLRQLRDAKGYSRQLLATAIGASINTLAAWEGGKWLPQVHQLGPLSRELGCSIDDLFEEDDDA
jgi:transcriptional regulator with XRE-family HTH domain